MLGHSFCESVTAGSLSRWHIRRLTSVGQKLGGGVDTDSLCGRVKSPDGWDLATKITERRLSEVACVDCAAAFWAFIAAVPRRSISGG